MAQDRGREPVSLFWNEVRSYGDTGYHSITACRKRGMSPDGSGSEHCRNQGDFQRGNRYGS